MQPAQDMLDFCSLANVEKKNSQYQQDSSHNISDEEALGTSQASRSHNNEKDRIKSARSRGRTNGTVDAMVDSDLDLVRLSKNNYRNPNQILKRLSIRKTMWTMK